MVSNIADILPKIVQSKKAYWRKNDFYTFLEENNFSVDSNSLLQLLLKLDLTDRDYQSLIADLFSEIVQDNTTFYDFALKFGKLVSGKPISDAQFFNSLSLICEKNPDIGFKLARKLLDDSDPSLHVYISLCLGIAGRSNEQIALSINQSLLDSNDPLMKATWIRTLRIMYQKITPTNKEGILKKFQENSKPEIDLGIRYEVLMGMFDLHRLDTKLCNQTIHELIEQDARLRLKTADNLQYFPLPNPQDTMELIQHCIDHEDFDVRRCCYFALTHLVESFPNEIVGIIFQNIEDFGYDFGYASYLLEELGKKNFDVAISLMSELITNELPLRVRFNIPYIMSALISKTNLLSSIPFIKQWLDDSKTSDMGLKITKEIISSQYQKTPDESFLDSLFSILEPKAIENNIDLKRVFKGESNKLFKCGQIIDALRYFSNDLDFDLLFSNLEKYPNIESFMGRKWFEERQKNNEKLHLLIRILAREPNLFDDAYLADLDCKLSKITSHGQKLKKFRDGLKDHDQFDDVLAEMDFIVPFLDAYEVEIEPPVKEKNLDVKIKFTKESVYVEIFSPEEFKPLRYLSGMIGIPNRVKKKIHDKYINQISYLEGTPEPVIIAVDIGRSEITCENIEEYVYGDVVFSFLMDTKSHETVGTRSSRSGEDMGNREPKTKIISAIICYETKKGEDGKFHTSGKLIKNPQTNNPLEPETEEELKRVLSLTCS
jgi:hypothetical protein